MRAREGLGQAPAGAPRARRAYLWRRGPPSVGGPSPEEDACHARAIEGGGSARGELPGPLSVAAVRRPVPRIRGRFSPQNAAYYGRRGAAERDRRFLARFRRPEDVRREERAELRWALEVVQEVFGPSWRPRRQLPALDDRTIGDLRTALSILHRNFDANTNSHRMRAVEAVLDMQFHPLFFEPVPSWINGVRLPLATVLFFGPPGPGPAGDPVGGG